jgi:hypothetical protein
MPPQPKIEVEMWQSIIGFVFSKIEKTFPQKKRGKM